MDCFRPQMVWEFLSDPFPDFIQPLFIPCRSGFQQDKGDRRVHPDRIGNNDDTASFNAVV